ncbi:MAG: MFS transporter, partial [Desulfobacterota bacterium]|nr:MFS transporter [Thermodesulfobacteriota bacterium]
QGMPLEQIGFLSILGLAWSLKLFWAPLVDRFGRRAAWIVPAQICCAGGMLLVPQFSLSPAPWTFWLVIGALCAASATQDIAIDAYTIDLLETRELGLANGLRMGAYRVALIAAGGGLVMLSDFVGLEASFVGVAVLMAVMALVVFLGPDFQRPRPAAGGVTDQPAVWQQLWAAAQGIRQLPHVWAVILFILTFKLGDAWMGSMVSPFWVDMGFSRTEIGLISGTFGAVATILGAMAGGYLTSRWGIAPALFILGAFQALSNLGYWIAAWPGMWRYATYLASLVESLTGGMGSAPFMAFMMLLCDKRHSATHYAFFSMLFGFTRSIAGYLGGLGAASFGYGPFFFYTFLAALPAFVLLPWIFPVARQREQQLNATTEDR